MSLEGLGYASALSLALLLALAAAAKVLTPDETRRSFHELGVPNPDAAARLVPLPEIAAAVLLVVVPAVGGLATLMLLAFFSTFIATRLRAGVAAPCACFGATSTQPLSRVSLARNGAMGVLALASLATLHPVRPTLLEVVIVVGYVGLVTLFLQLGARTTASSQG